MNPGLRIIFLPLATAVSLAVAPAAVAQEKFDNPETPPPPPEHPARLTWNNGESLPGELVGATDATLTWRSPLFSKPISLDLSALRSVTHEAETTAPDGSMAFNLKDGSRIYGELTGVEGDNLQVKSQRHGVTRIRKSELIAIHRLRGGNILWCGPFGEAGWKYASTKIGPGRRLQSGPGGSLQSAAWRQRVNLPLELPEKVEIEFRLSSSVQPEFTLRAIAGERIIALTTWKDELVIRRGNHFVNIGNLKPEDREVHFRLFWDRVTGSGFLATPSGQLVGKWQSEDDEETGQKSQPQPASRVEVPGGVINRIMAGMLPGLAPADTSNRKNRPSDGVALTNQGPDLGIDFLRIRNWDGNPPQKTMSDPFRTRLELAGGSAVEGLIVRGTADAIVFRPANGGPAERIIPIDEIESLYFPVGPSEEKPPKSDEFRFADGTWLQGRLLGIEGGSIKIESAASATPVTAAIDGLRKLEIRSAAGPEAEGEDAEPPVPLFKQDKLITGKTTIHGSWHPAAGEKIQWRLAGAAEPVEIASAAAMEMTRVPPADGKWPRSPALFHLTNGQVAPGELVAINGGGNRGAAVEYRSEVTEARQFSADQLHAIQFRGPDINPDGFNDPGWQIVRGGEKAVSVEKGLVTMDPGGSWGHPSILVGDEIRFTIQPSGYGTLRVRMFCEGTSQETPATSILLAHYGNEIYCGLEETPGQLNQRRDIAVPSNKPVKMRINWDNSGTRIHVNGTMAIRIPVGKKAVRSGLGLVIEPANLWGNGERQMKVSEFSLRAAPGVTWVPGVNADARERALFLPRFRKEDPPRHLLLASNGDVLRGTILTAAAERFGFRSGLEELSIPMERVAAAIWLKPPEDEDEDEDENEDEGEPNEEDEKNPDENEAGENEAGENEAEEPEGPEPTHWLLLTSGARLGLAVETFGPDFVTGHSQTLGHCRIPTEHVHVIRSTKPEVSPATLAFSNWQLKRAPEPFPASGGGDDSPLIGNKAPEINLEILDGKRFRLSEQGGRIVVLDFWATWCGPCIRAIPEMIAEFSQFGPEVVRFVGVNQAEPPDQIRSFVDQRGWSPFEVILDLETDAGRAYGVEGIPHTVIVDHEGKVAWVSTGFKPNGAKEAADVVRELLGKAGDRTERFLRAEDVRDLELQPGALDGYVASFVGDLLPADRGKALAVFEKAVEIVETSRERGVWNLKPGDQAKTFVGDAVIHLRDETDPVSWLTFQADLMRSGKIPPFELIRSWGEKKVIDALVGVDDQSKPGKPIEEAVRTVAEVVGNREFFPFAGILLNKVVQRYDLDTVSHLITTLESADETELSPFLKELKMAAIINIHMREIYRGRHYPPEAEAHYVAALRDDSVPLPIRILLLDFLTSGATPVESREILLAGVAAIADAWKGDTPVFQFWSMKGIENFMRLEQDEAWKAIAVRLGDGFQARYLSETAPAAIPHVPDDNLLNAMMHLYVATGRSARAKTLFERFKKRFVDFELPLLHFIRGGENDAALEVLEYMPARIRPKEFGQAFYDDALARNAPAFLETIESADLRLLAETLVASAPDLLPLGRKPLVAIRHGSARSRRLQSAAKKFGDVSFSKAPLKRRVLGLLGDDVAAARIVADELREEAEEIDIAAAIDARTFSTTVRENIITKPDLPVFRGALLLEMAEGNLEAANAMIDRAAAAEVGEPERKILFAEQIFDLPARAILGSTDSQKTADTLIPLCQRLALGVEGLEAREDRADKLRLPWAQLAFALVEAGRMEEFLPWLRAVDEGKYYKLGHERWRTGIKSFYQLAAEKYDGRPAEERIAYLNDLLAGKWVVDGFHSYTNGGFRSVSQTGLITTDELLEHGEAMATASPRNGHAWNDLGYVFEGAGRLEEAVRFWEKAAEIRLAENAESDAWRYRAHAVRGYYHRGRVDDAAEAIEKIAPEKYDSKDFALLREALAEPELGLLVANLGEWEAMTEKALADAPSIAAKVKRKPTPERKTIEIEKEPDPFGRAPDQAASPSPESTDDDGDGDGDGDDEPDPFGAMPVDRTRKAETRANDGDEPDPFGVGPEKKAAEKQPAQNGEGANEPDPFGAP